MSASIRYYQVRIGIQISALSLVSQRPYVVWRCDSREIAVAISSDHCMIANRRTEAEGGVEAMSVLDQLRPQHRPRVIDLVAEAGVDVQPWSLSAKGQVRVPASNPAYCYEWSHVQHAELVVLNVWHEQLLEVAGSVVCDLNPSKLATALSQATGLAPARRASGVARAMRMDRAIAEAHVNNLPVRLIVGDGVRRDLDDLAARASSSMEWRLLDETPWSVASYDATTGAARLVRGHPTVFIDQFSAEATAPPQRRDTIGQVFVRDLGVRQKALARARGTCELCGMPGFRTANGGTYLETHHVVPLSDGGPDHEYNVVALCPNDHRKAHHSDARSAISDALHALLATHYGL